MSTPRKKYSPEFKAKVLAPVLAGTQRQSEAVKQHGLSSSMISTWMKEAKAKQPKAPKSLKGSRMAKGEVHGAIVLLRKAEREILRRGTRLEHSDLLLMLALRMLEGEG